jgi:hypothetical protein
MPPFSIAEKTTHKNPINAPPNTLAMSPIKETPPFVPGGT